MQKATVEDALKIETRPRQKYALMARQVLGLASVKKLKAMQQRLAMGGLIHHSLIYAGADRTGRWSGSGIQPQNFPRGYGGDKLDKVFYALANLQPVENTHVSISQSLKGFIVGRDGRSLLIGDYSQIECRVLAWLAGQDDLLQVFADGGDPYCVMAEKVYHYPVNKKEHPEERQLGKALILGCGYGMGGAKFAVTAEAMYGLEVDPDRADELVSIYRCSYPAIKQFWGEVERAFRDCVGGHRISRQVGALTFRGHSGKHVSVELPSTRRLYYNNAHIEYGGDRDKYGNGAIAYYGKCPYTNKMVPSVKSYGAKVCLSGKSLVLTDRGVKRLDSVALTDMVWDGVNWVPHQGLDPRGVKTTISVDGVAMTPDHKVLTTQGWRNASQSNRYNRPYVRVPNSFGLCGFQGGKEYLEFCLFRLRTRILEGSFCFPTATQTRRNRFTVSSEPECSEPVYDLVNCGPLKRFAVLGSAGLMLVHNCENITQAVARDVMAEAMQKVDPIYPVILTVHDEVVSELTDGKPEQELEKFIAMLEQRPAWAQDLPLAVEAAVHRRYQK